MDKLSKPKNAEMISHQSQLELPRRERHAARSYDLENLDENDTDAGLLDYWRIFKRNSRTIVIAAFVGLLLGFAIGIPMKPVYRVKTSLEVLTLNEDFMNMKQSNPTTTNDGNYDTSEEQTQAKLLESNELLDRVIGKLDPSSPSISTTPHMATSGWRSLLHMSQPERLTPLRSELTKAASSLRVRPTTRTRVLEVTVDSTNPQLATDFANTLDEQFIAQSLEARWATTHHTSEWLRRELDDARDRLRKSEDSLQNYARSSGLIFTDESTNVATEKLQQLQQSLSAAISDRIARQSRYELAQNAPPDSLADVLSDGSLRDTQSKINELRRQIADLTAVYDPGYSKVRRLQAELDSLQPAFNVQRADIVTRIKNDYTESIRREKLLTQAYGAQERNVTGQDEKAIQYSILKRDVDSNRQLYDTMLQQMKQASIASAMRASNVRIVDPARLPDSPISPNFKLNSALGLLGGLFFSIVAATIKERADRTLRQPGDIKLWADIAEIGIIPTASFNAQCPLYYRSAGPIDSPAQHFGSRKQSETEPVELITWQKKPSLVAEAFRSALTSILFVGENGGRPRVLVFTSASAADGKTTVVSNIAIAAAEIRMRVLIIDADLRRPRMHQLFGLDNDRGLTSLLETNDEEVRLEDFIRKTSVDGLHVINAGPPTHAAAHMLYSPNFGATVAKLRSEYDMILIDTPPMLQMTDARVAGRLADAVILVARGNKTTRDALLAARERFDEDRIPVMGAILNDWNPKNSAGGYYGYYSGKQYSTQYEHSRN